MGFSQLRQWNGTLSITPEEWYFLNYASEMGLCQLRQWNGTLPTAPDESLYLGSAVVTAGYSPRSVLCDDLCARMRRSSFYIHFIQFGFILRPTMADGEKKCGNDEVKDL